MMRKTTLLFSLFLLIASIALPFAMFSPAVVSAAPAEPWPPITFDSAAVTYTLTGFGGAENSTVVADPTNAANNVARVVKSATAELWAGTTVSTGPNNTIPALLFTADNTSMTVRVWSPDAGIQVRLKAEDAANGSRSVETEATTTVANDWATLTFDFANPAAGTPPLNLSYTYNRVSIFFNFGVPGSVAGEKTYYFDDVTFNGETTPPPPPPATWDPITFDSAAVTYTLTGFGGAENSAVVADPTNAANNVARVVKSATAELWAGTTVSTGPNLSVPALPFTADDTTMTVRVWSPDAGIQVRLKAEDAANGSRSVETEATTTVANDWATLTFDFANPAAGTAPLNLSYTYDKVSIFFNFGVPGSVAGEKTYYFDDVTFGGGATPPPSSGKSVIIDDFEDGLLPTGTDPNGLGVGFVTWNATGASVAITTTNAPPAAVPGLGEPNIVLKEDLTIGPGQWAGFTHAFTNAAANEWIPQDWTSYEGFSLWVYGNNTGGTLFVDILENRNPGSTADDAERWSVDIPDNFSGWQYFEFPWSAFNRKDIGNGAPNDGFTREEIHGYGIGGYGNVNMGSQSYYVDQVEIFGNTGGGETPLKVEFALTRYEVAEGDTALIAVTLNMTSTEPVSINYSTAESYATPDRNFVPTSGVLVIPPGELEQTFAVTTLHDGKHTGDQQVMLNLRNPVGAEAGFRIRAMLLILDADQPIPTMIDDFQGFHRFAAAGDVELSITELAAGTPMALPGQGAYEDVLTGVYGPAGGSFTRTFPVSEDWSGYNGLSFWYYGSNSGQPITLNVLDNQTTTTAQTPANQWQLVWSDEFDDVAGVGPNPNVWSAEIGDGTMNGIPGWGNSELQFYTDSLHNAATDGSGNLVVTLDAFDPANAPLCWYGPCEYSSARLISADKIEAEFGRIEARALVPDGPAGLWPAFWMLGANIGEVGWPQSGEIDIMEYVSRNPNEVFGTIHGPGYSGGAAFGRTITLPQPVAQSYHTFGVEWSPDLIRWYVDGINYHTATPADVAPNEWVFNHPFYLILNLAVGGNFGGTISPDLTFPQQMQVDYVRVYQAPNTSERFEASFMDNFSGWRKVTVPFSAFTRSAQQPAGAPNDGFGRNQVWGYGVTLPAGSSGTLHMDQVQLARIPTVQRSRRFNIDQDTFINGAQPAVAFGSAQTMWIGFFDQLRPVVHAPIAGIPSDAAIDVAYLYLYVFEGRGFSQWSNSVISNVAAHAVTTPWVSETASWWTPWTMPGGDYGPTVGASHLGSGRINTWLRLDVTAAVQDIVSSGVNHGILLTSNDDRGVRYGLAASEFFDPSKSGYIRVYFRTVD